MSDQEYTVQEQEQEPRPATIMYMRVRKVLSSRLSKSGCRPLQAGVLTWCAILVSLPVYTTSPYTVSAPNTRLPRGTKLIPGGWCRYKRWRGEYLIVVCRDGLGW